jgi:hypothetical protein
MKKNKYLWKPCEADAFQGFFYDYGAGHLVRFEIAVAAEGRTNPVMLSALA